MIISLIVAMDESGGIGYKSRLPWRLASDLKRFKQITMGHHIVMGRKTFESIGKALPGREMIIISRNKAYKANSCMVVHSLMEALNTAEHSGEQEVFIIGGGEVFQQALHRADRIYLTLVHTNVPADVFFPQYDPALWEITESRYYEADPENQYPHTFVVLHKKTK
ncbi:MAG TPA: dihydrofolate reductase [Anaerolineales bacterium]|nr:dihydrofolate reductase [Anaerolineales bacterium]